MEKRIIWKRKKYSIPEIRKLSKKYKEIEIVNIDTEMAYNIMGVFGIRKWKIFDDINDEAPLIWDRYMTKRETFGNREYIHYLILFISEKEGEVILE